MLQVPSGVPQGSHCGPLLFNLFVNDISIPNSKFLMFADDLKVFRAVESAYDAVLLQLDLDRLSEWCSTNSMSLNVNKCYKITFAKINAPIHFDYSINNISLQSKNEMRDLGVTFDSKLLFNLHINNLCSKSLKMLGFVKRLSCDFSANSFKTLYCSLVRSVLEFASPVWSPCYACHINQIEIVQHKFLRHWSFKMGYYRDDDHAYNDLLLSLNMQTLEQRRFLADMSPFL